MDKLSLSVFDFFLKKRIYKSMHLEAEFICMYKEVSSKERQYTKSWTMVVETCVINMPMCFVQQVFASCDGSCCLFLKTHNWDAHLRKQQCAYNVHIAAHNPYKKSYKISQTQSTQQARGDNISCHFISCMHAVYNIRVDKLYVVVGQKLQFCNIHRVMDEMT